jgi:hypothetical protein
MSITKTNVATNFRYFDVYCCLGHYYSRQMVTLSTQLLITIIYYILLYNINNINVYVNVCAMVGIYYYSL